MSETVAYVGKLTPVDLEGLSVDEWIQKKLNRTELEFGLTWLEELDEACDNSPERFFYHEGKLYEVERVEFSPEDIAVSFKHADGTTGFVVSYYNGGCSFDEALEYAIQE